MTKALEINLTSQETLVFFFLKAPRTEIKTVKLILGSFYALGLVLVFTGKISCVKKKNTLIIQIFTFMIKKHLIICSVSAK